MSYRNPAWTKLLPTFIRTRLEGQEQLQKIISNAGWLSIERILRMALGMVVVVWVARYLGTEQFGLYNYVIAFVTLFSPLIKLGLDQIVIRDIVHDPSCTNETLGTSFVLKLAGGIVTLFLSILIISLIRPGDGLLPWLVGITAIGTIFQAFDIIDLWFQSQVQSKNAVWVRSSAFIVTALGKIVLIQIGSPLIAFLAIVSLEFVLTAVGFVVVYHLNGNTIRLWTASLTRARVLMRDSWPLILSAVVAAIYLRIDQIMLGQMVGEAEVGLYAASVLLAEAWYFIPVAIVWSVFPSIVETRDVNETLFYQKLQNLYNLMAFLGYLVAIPTTFLSGWVIETLFGPTYAQAGPMLAILIWAGLFINLDVARAAYLIAMNWTTTYFITTIAGAIVNVVLNYYLIPLYGGVGCAIATSISYWVLVHGSCILSRRLFQLGVTLSRALIYPKIW